MNNIKATAIRLIANAFLFSKEKSKECHEYCFDSSFLTKRNITSISDMQELQNELNKLGWCFNILNFNSFIIQEKTFLAEVVKLGFGRLDNKNDLDVSYDNALYIKNRVVKTLWSMLRDKFVENNIIVDLINVKEGETTTIAVGYSKKARINISLELQQSNDEYLVSVQGFGLKGSVGCSITKQVKELLLSRLVSNCLYTVQAESLSKHISNTISSILDEKNFEPKIIESNSTIPMYEVYAVPRGASYLNRDMDILLFKIMQEDSKEVVKYKSKYSDDLFYLGNNEHSFERIAEEAIKDL